MNTPQRSGMAIKVFITNRQFEIEVLAVDEIQEMRKEEMVALLRRATHGHLACARGSQPYIIPIGFAYEDPFIYFFTTEGMKSDFMASNSRVCFQVEDVNSHERWKSVIVFGTAEHVIRPQSVREIIKLMTGRNPRMVPAIAKTWKEDWGFRPVGAAFRIRISKMSGRKMG